MEDMFFKYCVYDSEKICDECNKCNICDLDPNKICDSCGKCLLADNIIDYAEIKLDGVIQDDMSIHDYLYENEDMQLDDEEGSHNSVEDPFSEEKEKGIQIEYIEDIPELKSEYDKLFESIFSDEKNQSGHQHSHHDENHCHEHNCSHEHKDHK